MTEPESEPVARRSILSRVPVAALVLLAGGAFLYVVYLMAK